MRGSWWLVLAVSSAVLAAPAVAIADPPAPTQPIVDGVNARRAVDRMPPLAGDAAMHQGCLNHVDYGLRNFGVSHGSFGPDPHNEDPARPGYTDVGRKAAGRSILGYGVLNDGRPFHHAPAHLFHFLSPFPLKVGVAERTETLSNGKRLTLGCMWSANADADDVEQRRAPANPPRPWSVPFDGQTGVPVWESQFDAPPTLAYEVGLTSDPNGPLLTGPALHLYHDDVGTRRLDALCQAVLLGPGGEQVPGGAAPRGQFQVKDPLLPGARYRHVETFGSAGGCASDVQRTVGGAFTTSDRKGIGDVVRLGEPARGADGHWVARATIDEEIGFFTKGDGTLRLSYDMASTSEQAFPGTMDYGTFDFTLSYGPVGQTLVIEAIPDQQPFGPTCFSPNTIVRRTYRHGADGVVAVGPQEVVRRGPDPCVAAPDVAAAMPASGGPGTVVRLDGEGLRQARAVRFAGGASATRWRSAEDGDLLVTVPNGAADGPVEVETPWGVDTQPGFDVTADTAAPISDLLLGPSGNVATTTASFAFDVEPGSKAECRLDNGPWQPCSSPRRIEGLAHGAHTFGVRATDPAGNVEANPPARAWTATAGPVTATPTVTDGAVGQDGTPGTGTIVPPPPKPDPEPVRPDRPNGGGSVVKPADILVLRSGVFTLRRAKGRLPRRGRVVTLGKLRADRTATATLTVRAGRQRLLRLRRRVRRGAPVTVRVTLPKALAKRKAVTLSVTIGRRTARVTARR